MNGSYRIKVVYENVNQEFKIDEIFTYIRKGTIKKIKWLISSYENIVSLLY